MQSMAGLWGKVWGRTPPPGVLGSVLISELRPRNPQAGRAGQGGHVPGGRAVWHCRALSSGFVSVLLSWWPAPDFHVLWGLWRVLKMVTNGVTPGSGISCDVWGRTPRGLGGEGRAGRG